MVRAWHGHGMESVNQARPHCVNQMGKIHSKPLAAWHGRGTAWVRHAMCDSAFSVRWIGRQGQTWPPRNPYLIQCDFVLGFWAREKACN